MSVAYTLGGEPGGLRRRAGLRPARGIGAAGYVLVAALYTRSAFAGALPIEVSRARPPFGARFSVSRDRVPAAASPRSLSFSRSAWAAWSRRRRCSPPKAGVGEGFIGLVLGAEQHPRRGCSRCRWPRAWRRRDRFACSARRRCWSPPRIACYARFPASRPRSSSAPWCSASAS